MNYTTLTEQIKAYANRDDASFIGQIPNFITQGINRIYSEAKNIGFEIIIKGDIPANAASIDKPANWRQTISFKISSADQSFSRFLFNRSYEFCNSYWPDQSITGEPQFYADYDAYNKIFISPSADKDYKYSIIYLGIPLFNSENSENFLTRRYPRLLFYACMLEAMPFLKDDERLGQFEQLYASSLDDINQDSRSRYNDRTSDRSK
jgi:hypothetical protein